MEDDVQSEFVKAIRARDAAADLLAYAQKTGSRLIVAYELQLRSMQEDVDRLELVLNHQESDCGAEELQRETRLGKKRILYRVA